MTSTEALPPQALAADRGASRLAAVPEQLHQEIGRPVDDTRLIAEPGRRVHEPKEVHELLDPVQIAERVFHRRQGHQRGVARGFVALLERQVLADDTRQVALTALPRRRAGEIEQVLNGVVRNIVSAGRIRPVQILEIRQLETELLELRLDVHARPPSSS